MSKVGESLIVEVARDSASLTFGFVGEIQTRIGEFANRADECRACGHDSSSFKDGPQESQQRERQENRERRRRPRKRSFGHSERKTQRRGGCEIFCESSSSDGVRAGFQTLHRELRFTRELLFDRLSLAVDECERILKLLGERATADRRHVEQQTVL